MDDFNTIRLKKKSIEKFKEYSKKVSPNYSETLDYMIAFFEDNHLSPYDTLNSPMWSFNRIINKRMDAVAAILRNMEKTQLMPAREMLESLFEGVEEEEKPIYIERTKEEIEAQRSDEERLIESYHQQYLATKKELIESSEKLLKIESKLVYIKNTFGKNYYRLHLSQIEYDKFKENLNN